MANSENWIKQIAAGEVTYDIAVQHGITFKQGSTDLSGTAWDGTSDLEVVIPSVADIVNSPVVFAGTVGENGVITWASPFSASDEDKKGYLLYITANCEFPVAGNYCEAGDMAINDGTTWHVISGENQVSLEASALALGKTAQSVITVEGQTLTLAVDYADVRSEMSFATNDSITLDVSNGEVTVAPKYIGISQADGSTVDITTSVSIDLPTALSNGDVTINENVLEASNFVFTSGSYPTITKNSEAIAVNASHSMTIAASGNGSFVTDVTAIKGVAFAAGTSASHQLAYVAELSTDDGASFVNGIHVKASDEEATTAFTAWGQATVATSSFVSGLSEAAASGDVVSSITVGAVSLVEGSDILTGLSAGGDSVITAVSFGTLGVDTDKSWFFSGLGEGSDVVTNVAVGAVSIVSDSNSSFAGNAITEASVVNHVLTFSTGAFMTPVALSKAADTITKGGFTKSGVQLSGTSATSDTFTKGAISQATTAISYKSVLFDNVTLSQASTDYVLDKAAGTSYSAIMGYVNLSVTDADVTKNGAVLENTTITASIPANAVAVDVTAGTLPTFAVNAATGSLTGSVGTSLTTSSVSWLGVDPSKKDIAVAGAWSMIEASTTFAGAVEVAAADTYAVQNGNVTIDEETFVTNVFVDGGSVNA